MFLSGRGPRSDRRERAPCSGRRSDICRPPSCRLRLMDANAGRARAGTRFASCSLLCMSGTPDRRSVVHGVDVRHGSVAPPSRFFRHPVSSTSRSRSGITDAPSRRSQDLVSRPPCIRAAIQCAETRQALLFRLPVARFRMTCRRRQAPEICFTSTTGPAYAIAPLRLARSGGLPPHQ